MKRISIAIALVLATPSLAPGHTAPQSKSCEQAAKELESRGIEIAQNFDKAAYEQFVSDDAVIIANNGEAFSKKQQIAALTAPPRPHVGSLYDERREDPRVRRNEYRGDRKGCHDD